MQGFKVSIDQSSKQSVINEFNELLKQLQQTASNNPIQIKFTDLSKLDSQIQQMKSKINDFQNSMKPSDDISGKYKNLADQINRYIENIQLKLQNFQNRNRNNPNDILDMGDIPNKIQEINEALNSITPENFAAKVQDINMKFKELNADLIENKADIQENKNAMNDLGIVHENLFSTLDKDISKFGEWLIAGSLLVQSVRAIKSAIQEVTSVDTEMTQLSLTMKGTSQEFKNMETQSFNVAKALGANVDNVLEAEKTYSNMNETLSTVVEKSKAAVIMSNLTGLSAKDSANNIMAATNQFSEMSGKDMEVVDQMSKVAANMTMNFADAQTNLANAVKVSGSAISQAKVPFSTYLGILAETEDKTRLSGETIGKLVAV